MGKKNRICAAAASTSAAAGSPRNSMQVANLRTLNAHLVKDVAECRKQIDQLRLQIASMATNGNICDAEERGVSKLALSASMEEAAAGRVAEMAAATERETNLMMTETESVMAELNGFTLRLQPLAS